jgi:uncharacterized protein YndB with AHSA1/START domain
MGLDIAEQTMIDAPADRVWAYLADFGRHPEWARPKDELRIQPPTEVRVGATFSSVGKDMGRDAKNAVTITEVVPGERIVYVATMDQGTVWRNAFELEQVGGRTRVTKRETLVSARFPWNVLTAILAPLMKGEAAKMHASDLARIKARLEQRVVAEVA